MALLRDWSVTASANNGAATSGYFPEGMQFSEFNDAMREAQAIVARYHADNNGALLTQSDSASASFSLNTSQSITAQNAGDRLKFRPRNATTQSGGVGNVVIAGTAKALLRAPGSGWASVFRPNTMPQSAVASVVLADNGYQLMRPVAHPFGPRASDSRPLTIYRDGVGGIEVDFQTTDCRFFDLSVSATVASTPFIQRLLSTKTVFRTTGTPFPLELNGGRCILPNVTVADANAGTQATATGAVILVTDLSGGAGLAYSDGGTWKRVSDGTDID